MRGRGSERKWPAIASAENKKTRSTEKYKEQAKRKKNMRGKGKVKEGTKDWGEEDLTEKNFL